MNQISKIIKSRIQNSGPITFADFMELALYHPEHGYYASGKVRFGKDGDFYTSPYVHNAFGQVIAGFIVKSREAIGGASISILELGAGKGYLALDALDTLRNNYPECYEKVFYAVVEGSSELIKASKNVLNEHQHKIQWYSSIDELEGCSITGVIVSNELFDSLPFHRMIFQGGSPIEIYVSTKDNEFVEIMDIASSEELIEYLGGIDLVESQEIEINLEAKKWYEKLGKILAKGFVLTIDYGYLAGELFSPKRMKGTYKSLYRNSINEDVYSNIGERDITAHVDFSNLIKLGQSHGLNKFIYTTQGQFLIDWGILTAIEREKDYRKKMAIKNLFLPESMGDSFKVLLQEKGINNFEDFYQASPFKISFNIS